MVDNTAHLISRARCAINRFLVAALRANGMGNLSPSHGDIIAGLLYHEAMTMTELARRINRDRSTVTTLVQKLNDEGYVTFQDNPDDARSRLVSLTPQGLALRTTFEAISTQLSDAMWQDIDAERRADFRDVLLHITHNFEETTADDGS
jgi:MarR family transcriptional regulator, organic hydroperoxide resistance regulator